MSCVAGSSIEDIAERYRRKLAGKLRGSPTRTDGFDAFVIRAPAKKAVTAESAVTPELDVSVPSRRRTEGFHGFVIRAPPRKAVTAESAPELDVGGQKTSTEALATCAAEHSVVVSEGTREEQPTRRVQTNAERSLTLSEVAERDTSAFAGCSISTAEGLAQGTPHHAGTCGPCQNATLPPVARTTDSQTERQAAESSPKQQLSDANETGAGPQVAAVAPFAVLSSRPEEGGDLSVLLASPAHRSPCAVANDPEGNEVLPSDGGCFEGFADAPGVQVRKSKDALDPSAPGKADGMPLFEDVNTCSRTSKGEGERFMNKSPGPRPQPATERPIKQDSACGTFRLYAAVEDCLAEAWAGETEAGIRTSTGVAKDCPTLPGGSPGILQSMVRRQYSGRPTLGLHSDIMRGKEKTGEVGEDVYREPPVAGSANLKNARQVPARSEAIGVHKQSGMTEITRTAGCSPSLSRNAGAAKSEKDNPMALQGDMQLVNALEGCETAVVTTSGPDASLSSEAEHLEIQKAEAKRKTFKKGRPARKTASESVSEIGGGKQRRRAGKGRRRNRNNKADQEAAPGLPVLRRGMVARKAGSVADVTEPGAPATAVLTSFIRDRTVNDGTEHPAPGEQLGEVAPPVDLERSRRYPERKRRPPREYWILNETRRRA